MEIINVTPASRAKNPLLSDFVNLLDNNQANFGLSNAKLYHNFPIFRDDTGDLVESQLLLLSPRHGLVMLALTNAPTHRTAELAAVSAALDQVFSLLFSRLLRDKSFRSSRTTLSVNVVSAIYAPNWNPKAKPDIEHELLTSEGKLRDFLTEQSATDISTSSFAQLVATIEGSRAIIKSKPREGSSDLRSLGDILSAIETEICTFDAHQKQVAITEIAGPQRIRGLAGSGKTVVLAMKAALAHLRHPQSRILFTFHTKSLYQHIKRLITRFYRQYDDRDPDWNRLSIMHSWGGATAPGVYYMACAKHGVPPINLERARTANRADPFDYVCSNLLATTEILPAYDYVFIDEGQDLPVSFVRLCRDLAVNRQFVLAYDEMQSIFRSKVASAADIFGTNQEGKPRQDFDEDKVLYKCYRNPREILVAAHAVGFGVYGQMVQILENKEHWSDIGYIVRSGSFVEGDATEIERPVENSLTSVSGSLPQNEILQAFDYENFREEIAACAKRIRDDIAAGARPDDILVAVVDDRNARDYLFLLERELSKLNVVANDIHTGTFGMSDFYVESEVTLSTVHKAKGNEAFIVHVLGVDALFYGTPGVHERNVLFTAMTRAKAIVYVSGVGDPAKKCKAELQRAMAEFPFLRFVFPGPGKLKRLRRDLNQRASRRLEAERQLERLRSMMTEDEIGEVLAQLSKKSHSRAKSNKRESES